MENLLRELVKKYTGIAVDDNNQNLLALPVCNEIWLYIIIVLEEKYDLPMIQVLENLKYNEFNIGNVSEKLLLMS